MFSFFSNKNTVKKEKNGVTTITSNTFVLFLRMLFMTVVSLYTVRCVLNGLGVVDYGVLNAVAGIVTASTCVSSVLALSTQRFYSFAMGKGQHERLREIFSVSLNLVVILSIILLIIFITLGSWFVNTQLNIPPSRQSAAQWLLILSLISFIFSILQIPYMGAVFAHEDMEIYALISILDCICKLIVAVNIKNTPINSLIFYGIGFAVIALFDLIAYIIIAKHKYKECNYIKVTSKEILKELISFSGWTFYGSVAGVSMTQGSTILLNIFFGPIINAAFNIGNQVFNALSTLSNSIIFAFRPAMIKAYSGDNHNYLEKLFSINNRILLNLLICITIPLLLETKSILSLWLGDITEDMVIFTQLYIIYEIIFTIHNPITIIIQATGKVRLYSIIVESLTILCLPISWVLFKMGFSATYLFYTMIGICFIAHIARLIVLKSIYQEFNLSNYALKDFLPAVLTFSVTYACISSFHLHIHNVILRLPIVCITSIMLTMLLAYFINSSHEERQFINKYIIRQR